MRMKVGFLAALACAFVAAGASAQDIPRIKARILSFDGKTLSVTSGTAGQSLAIGLIPSTRLMYEVLGNQYDRVCIIGCVDLWRNPQNNVLAAFQKLESMIRSLQVVQTYNFAAGTYGATIDGNDIEITY